MSVHAATTRALWVDDRYRGLHGIGRYSLEVTSRLSLRWSPLALEGAPADPLDFARRLPAGAREGVVYSPGYGVLSRARAQVLTIHDLIHFEVDWPGRAKYLAYYNGPVRRMIRRTGVVLTVSRTSQERIREWLGDPSIDVVDAGIGCSSVFTPGPARRDPPPAAYVLAVGNLRPHKNLEVVFAAMATIRGLDLRLVLPLSEVNEGLAKARAAGLDGRVIVHCDVDDAELAELYRGAVLTAFPSTREGFGLPALESIMCGTPVVYWRGCLPVAETVGPAGRAVGAADDAAEWAAVIAAEISYPTVVEPPIGRYDWDRTASLVGGAVSRVLSA